MEAQIMAHQSLSTIISIATYFFREQPYRFPKNLHAIEKAERAVQAWEAQVR